MASGTDNATMRTTSVGSAVDRRFSSASSLCHSSTGAIGSITRSSTPGGSVVLSPAGLAGESSAVETIEGRGTSTIDERGGADERDVVD